jgi:hypothetical protein
MVFNSFGSFGKRVNILGILSRHNDVSALDPDGNVSGGEMLPL